MPWINGHIHVSHPREPWDEQTPDIIVQATLNRMKGKKGTPDRAAYAAAKREFNLDAAAEIVERCLRRDAVDSVIAQVIAEVVHTGTLPRLVLPHPAFDDEDGGAAAVSGGDRPVNALPFAYANLIKVRTNCEVDEEIVQAARVGRTKLTKFQRFLYQPTFGGTVRAGQSYILVDDAVTTAGTLAALRSYIVRNGGRVLCCTTLANAAGQNQPFALRVQTRTVLAEAFEDRLEPFWRETVGHSDECLTEAEGRCLGEWCNEQKEDGSGLGDELLQRLRARLDEVAAA